MRRGCARLCSHSGSSRSLGGESRKSWDTCLTSSPKRSRGKKGRKPRARGKGKEAWRGWMVEGPRVPPGPKSTFALKRSDFKENPASEASAFPGRAPSGKARLRREVRCASKSQKYGDVKNTRDVSCTLCIRSAGSRPRPREEVERRLRGFPTQGSNPGFPHCRRILYELSHQESPIIIVDSSISLCSSIFLP